MLSIFKKEINTFFSSFVGYIVIGVFLLALGWIMWIYPETSILTNEFASLSQLFIGAPIILSFIIPAITMRSFAEEHQLGTIELLATKPVKDIEIILGKFFASFVLVLLMLIPTLIYYYSVYKLGSPIGNIDTGGVIGSYIGLLFLSGAFVSIGLLCSSMTKNIIVSLILGIVACLFFYQGLDLMSRLPIYFGSGDNLIRSLGIDFHYNSLRRGLLDTRDMLYFVSFIGVFLSMTLISFNSRKWQIKDVKLGKGIAKTSSFHSLVQPLIVVLIFVFLAVIGSFLFTKFDLTDDERFSLSDSSISQIEAIDEVMDITVLLGGELPADYQRLQDATFDLLDDLRSYSSEIEYSFDNPLDGTKAEVDENLVALGQRDIVPVPIKVPGNVSRELKLIVPFAVINYKGQTRKVNLLESIEKGMSERAVIEKSVNMLEFKFINTIKKMETSFRPVITYTLGHGELEPIEFADLRKSLHTYYDMGGINLDSMFRIDSKIDILVIPRPRTALSDKDLFKIDQYVMNGGKVIWAIDVMNINIDTLGARGSLPYIASEFPSAEKIGNLLFKYGVRIRPSNFVFDEESSRIPLQTGVQGNKPTFDLFPWFYHPIISPKSDHPIVKGLDRVNLKFPTVIDTSVSVRTNLRKEVLLSSSNNSKIRPNTHRFSFDEVSIDPTKLEYNSPNQPVAVLLEGEFPSAYRNQISSAMAETLKQINSEFKETSIPTKMIVIADGDVMRNWVDPRSGYFDPLGYNKFENYAFANKDFMINCIEYLMEGKDVLDSRSKVVELRLLDKVKAQTETMKWRILNVGVPIVLLLIAGFAYNYIRRRKYAA